EILGRRQKTAFGQLETGLQMLLLDGAQKYETSSGGNHDTTRRALLYDESLGQASVEDAESHLLECAQCQEFRRRVIQMKSLFRSSFSGASDENEEKMGEILDLLRAAEIGGGRQKRFGKLGREVGWIAAAILIFLVLGAIFNRINPLTEVRQAIEQQNNSRPATEVIVGDAEITLSIAPVVDLPTPSAPVEPGYSWDPEISANGQWIVFNSSISNLVAGDGNQTSDIFVLNRLTGEVERVSLDSHGIEANGSSLEPEISHDGRYIVFTSWADNLIAGDDQICSAWGIASSCPDIYLHDRRTGETVLVSKNSDGNPGADFSISPRISADGNTIVFWSAAGDLTGDDYRDCQGLSGSPRQTSCLDLFIYDRNADTIRRLPIGRDPLSHFEQPYDESLSISGDGRWLVTAIQSRDRIAETLGITSSPELYLFNLESGEIALLNSAADGTPGNAPSYHASLSGDGRYIAFSSRASNLVPDDTNNRIDVFLRDRENGEVLRLSTKPDGGESSGHSGVIEPDSGWMGNGLAISSDGNWIVYASTSLDLVSEPKDYCTFAQTCQNLFLTHRTGGETRQLNLTNLDFQPFLSVTEFGEFTLFMAAVSTSCSQGDHCGEIYLHDRLGGDSVLVGGTEATTGLLVPQGGLHSDSHNLWLHSNRVSSVLFSPDGKTVTSGSLDGSIKLTSIDDETVVGTIVGDGKGITALAYSPAGDQLAAVNQDGDVSIWKLPEGNLISLLGDFPGVQDAVFSPDGDSLALGGEGGVWIWDTQDGMAEDRFEVERGDIGAVRYSPDGRLLAAANKDHTIWIWDLARGGPAYRLGGHTERVNELKFSPDGNLLASASNDGKLNVWQVSQS
ncbi:MAG TPA: hypothetical protein VJ768_03195, partial [Anaerolineales bacterium]|nr:hypothetical protein [Anaerolineales bacterium]